MTKSVRSSASHRQLLWHRMITHSAIAFGLLGFSLLIGMWGYEHYEHMFWRDAFVNAAMLLGGMGPIKTDLSDQGKVFAGLYALYSGLIVIAVAGLLLGPGVHHLMHHVHWNEGEDKSVK
jgi:hypothetical protein